MAIHAITDSERIDADAANVGEDDKIFGHSVAVMVCCEVFRFGVI